MFVLLHDKNSGTGSAHPANHTNNRMNKYISYIAILLTACTTCAVTSCISDDDIEVNAECYIYSFSVSDIKTTLHTLTADGIDSTYTRTVGGSNIKFNIDQVNGRIYSIDSLPSWVDLTRVVPSIGFSGYLYAMVDSVYYPISGSSDSLNLSTPLNLLVVATDGVSMRHYTAVINHAAINADSLLWTEQAGHNLQPLTDQRLVAHGRQMYAFGTQGTNTMVQATTDGQTWTTPMPLNTPTGADIDLQSITPFGNYLYASTADQQILRSANATDWQTATDTQTGCILAADTYYLYAYDGQNIMATTNLTDWTTAGTTNLDMLPQSHITSLTYPTHTNPDLAVSTMIGLNPQAPYAVAWYKISSANPESNQRWDYITITDENTYPLPALQNLTAFYLNKEIYAMGGANDRFYKSADNGITWHEATQNQFPPATLTPNTPVSTLAWNGYVWMIQTDLTGTIHIYRGHLNQ